MINIRGGRGAAVAGGGGRRWQGEGRWWQGEWSAGDVVNGVRLSNLCTEAINQLTTTITHKSIYGPRARACLSFKSL